MLDLVLWLGDPLSRKICRSLAVLRLRILLLVVHSSILFPLLMQPTLLFSATLIVKYKRDLQDDKHRAAFENALGLPGGGGVGPSFPQNSQYGVAPPFPRFLREGGPSRRHTICINARQTSPLSKSGLPALHHLQLLSAPEAA